MRAVLPLVLLTLAGTLPSATTLPTENPPTFTPALPVGVAARTTTPTWTGPQPRSADGWYALGRQATRSADHGRAAQAFLQAAALNPSAANWRAAGDAQVKLGDYEAATRAYEQAAARYRARGDDITARALEHQTAPYRQVLRAMLLTTRQTPDVPGRLLARLEPARGILLGSYVDGSGVTGTPPTLAPALREFAVAFRYWQFTASTDPVKIFPGRFAQAVKANGGALHLALEPGMPLSSISDTIVLRFARAARDSGVPVFLRFASEMNDAQNAWSRDPALYRTTFARVARLVRAQAPNVAMVWMPMPGDLGRMATYYPGADAVDWAGLSLYSVPFENGDVRQPRVGAHPLDLVRAFYDRYAPAHPIQLSEYASSHRSGAAPTQDYSAFAAQQLREVYWGAWLTMPRLKNINWLDLDMLTGANGGKIRQRRNDYRLFTSPAKSLAFGALRSQDAFLTRWSAVPASGRAAVPIPWPAQVLAGQRAGGALWVQLAQPVREVRVRLDGRPVRAEATLPHRFTLEAGLLTAGPHRLEVQVLGAAGQVLLSDTRAFEAVMPR